MMSPCSSSCGGGKRQKHRYYEKIEGAPNDTYCSGDLQNLPLEDCNTDKCPGNYFQYLNVILPQLLLVETQSCHYKIIS